MHLPIYIVDAFADRPLAGNPAAVCPLDAWLPGFVASSAAGWPTVSSVRARAHVIVIGHVPRGGAGDTRLENSTGVAAEKGSPIRANR